MLHGGLLAFSVVLVGLIAFVSIAKKFNLHLMGTTFFITLFLVCLVSFSPIFGDLTTYRIEDGIGNAIQLFNEKLLLIDARTTYKSHVEIEDIWDLGFLLLLQ